MHNQLRFHIGTELLTYGVNFSIAHSQEENDKTIWVTKNLENNEYKIIHAKHTSKNQLVTRIETEAQSIDYLPVP